MIIFLHGPDAWRLKMDARAAVRDWRQKHPDAVPVSFELAGDLGGFERAIKYPSLLDTEQFFTVTDAFADAATAEAILGILQRHETVTDTHTTVLVAEPSDEKIMATKGRELLSFLKTHADQVMAYPFLTGVDLIRWITSECRINGCTISPAAARELVQRTGNESWALANEIAKLSCFARDGTIQQKDLQELATGQVDLNIFDFIDALATKNRTRALELLYRELTGGRDPYYLLTMIIFQFRNLLIVKDLATRGMAVPAIAKAAGIHPFVARKAFGQARKFHDADLKRVYHKLFVLDTEAKAGTIDLSSSLNTFILGL